MTTVDRAHRRRSAALPRTGAAERRRAEAGLGRSAREGRRETLEPPVASTNQRANRCPSAPAPTTWGSFLWLAISMGALSLLTPCVFPMVPITVSYFTKHAAADARPRGRIRGAVRPRHRPHLHACSAVSLAAVAGAAGLNRFAANPWVNLAITALFVVVRAEPVRPVRTAAAGRGCCRGSTARHAGAARQPRARC